MNKTLNTLKTKRPRDLEKKTSKQKPSILQTKLCIPEKKKKTTTQSQILILKYVFKQKLFKYRSKVQLSSLQAFFVLNVFGYFFWFSIYLKTLNTFP